MLNLNSPDSNSNSLHDPVSLNVGGEIYTTTLDTLTRCRDSMLGAMFTGQISTLRDKRGNVFIDRDGKVFRHILNYLRSSSLDLPEGFSELPLLRREADFFQVRPLLEEIRRWESSGPLSRRDGPRGAMLLVDVDCQVCASVCVTPRCFFGGFFYVYMWSQHCIFSVCFIPGAPSPLQLTAGARELRASHVLSACPHSRPLLYLEGLPGSPL